MFSWSKWQVKGKEGCDEETVNIWTNAERSEETIATFARQQRKRYEYVVNMIDLGSSAGKGDYHLYLNITKNTVLTICYCCERQHDRWL